MTFVHDIKQINVEPTTVCQAECSMCTRTLMGYHNNDIENKTLTIDQFKELVLPLLPLDKISFCGTLGDPLACNDLYYMIDWATCVDDDVTIGINTNGALGTVKLWKDIATLLKDNIYSYVVFSIDGLDDTNHLYRKKVNWSKVMRNAKAYIKAGGIAHWDMIVFEHNKHQIAEARIIAKDMGFTVFRTKQSSRIDRRDHKEKKFFCDAEDEKSVYLSAEGMWYPCCHTHSTNHKTNCSGFYDVQWGDPITNIDDRTTRWYNLEKNIISKTLDEVCYKCCGTELFAGQWTGEWYFK